MFFVCDVNTNSSMCTGSFRYVFIEVMVEYRNKVATLDYSSFGKSLRVFVCCSSCGNAGGVSLSHVCHECDVCESPVNMVLRHVHVIRKFEEDAGSARNAPFARQFAGT